MKRHRPGGGERDCKATALSPVEQLVGPHGPLLPVTLLHVNPWSGTVCSSVGRREENATNGECNVEIRDKTRIRVLPLHCAFWGLIGRQYSCTGNGGRGTVVTIEDASHWVYNGWSSSCPMGLCNRPPPPCLWAGS